MPVSGLLRAGFAGALPGVRLQSSHAALDRVSTHSEVQS